MTNPRCPTCEAQLSHSEWASHQKSLHCSSRGKVYKCIGCPFESLRIPVKTHFGGNQFNAYIASEFFESGFQSEGSMAPDTNSSLPPTMNGRGSGDYCLNWPGIDPATKSHNSKRTSPCQYDPPGFIDSSAPFNLQSHGSTSRLSGRSTDSAKALSTYSDSHTVAYEESKRTEEETQGGEDRAKEETVETAIEAWSALSGGQEEWEKLKRMAVEAQDSTPFSSKIPESLESVVKLVMGLEGWKCGTDYPTKAVTDEAPSYLLLQTQRSATWLVRLNAASSMDLGLSKASQRDWDCLPPSQTRHTRHFDILIDSDDEEESILVKKCTKRDSEVPLMLVKNEKVCSGTGIRRWMFYTERKKEDGESELSPFALTYGYYPTGTQPSSWPIVLNRGKKTEKALRMRPSLVHSLTDKVKVTRDLGSAKKAYCDELGASRTFTGQADLPVRSQEVLETRRT